MPGPAPLSKDLKELIELFQSHKVKFLVVGAHALAFHARPRFTEDLDLFVQRSAENCKRVREALDEFGFGLTDEAERDLAENPRAMIVLGEKPNQIDILNFLSGVHFDAAWSRRVNGALSDLNVDYIGLTDYVTTKLASGRPKDQLDLILLQEIVGDLPPPSKHDQ